MSHSAFRPLRPLSLLLLLCCAVVAPLGAQQPPPAAEAPYDVVITGGRIVDGSGSPWFYGDLAIRGDRIARITPGGLLSEAPARQRIDAHGLVVAPGFIDIQSHSRDAFLSGDGRVISKVTQGITSEILGEGWTNAPANEYTLAFGTADPAQVELNKQFVGPHGFNKWLEAMKAHGTSPNFGSFLGATTVRMYAKGMTPGPANPEELDTMRELVREAMEDGAFGLATALIYPPGSYAATDEIIELARAMAPYGGVYITHMRSEADLYIEAIDEALAIGRAAGVPVEIYHLKAAGQRDWFKAPLAIARINGARAEGTDIQADMYPYVAGGTGLSACLPPWASANGKLFDNLRDPAVRTRIHQEVLHPTAAWENLCELSTPAGVLILGLKKPENQAFIGKRLSDIAAQKKEDWVEAAMDLVLSEESRVDSIFFLMSEDNVKLQLQQPWIKFGTDEGGYDPNNPEEMVHPRSYGTFPRILGRYVRQERVLTLEEAVRKMTSAVADRLSLHDRGLLRPGMYADVVVFNPQTIIDHATFEQPHQLSEGVEYVFVNGVAVVHEGKHTGATPGRILRGPGYVPRD